MHRLIYTFKVLIAHIVSAAMFYWLFCPYNVAGAEGYLPARSLLRCVFAIGLIIITGASLRTAKVPPVSSIAFIGKKAFQFIYQVSVLSGLVALLRFSIPLVWSKLPFFGEKLTIPESLFWSGLLIITSSALRILPLFTRNVLLTANEAFIADHRKPILYFRSFEKELAKASISGILLRHVLTLRSMEGAYMFSTGQPSQGGRMIKRRSLGSKRSVIDEQMIFADAINTIGPYVALGRPTENFRDMDLGAAKEYVSNDEWQTKVIEWIKKCAAVVVEAADSQSLGWELAQIVEMLPPHRIMLICPHSDKEYSVFLDAYHGLFPNGLPKERPKSRLLTFDNNWHPIELENINMNVSETLQPFFGKLQLGIC